MPAQRKQQQPAAAGDDAATAVNAENTNLSNGVGSAGVACKIKLRLNSFNNHKQESYSSTEILNQEEDLAFDAAMAQEFSSHKRSAALNYNSDSAAESSGTESNAPLTAANRRKLQKTGGAAVRHPRGMMVDGGGVAVTSSDGEESDEDPSVFLPPICKRVVFGSHSQLLGEGEKAPDSHTHKWKLFCQGYQGEDITHWCRQVVIKLHDSFAQPKRVLPQPPYEVHETGWGEFEVAFEFHFRDPKLKPVIVYHLLKLHTLDTNGPSSPQAISRPAGAEGGEIVEPIKEVLSEKYEEILFPHPLSPAMRDCFAEYERRRAVIPPHVSLPQSALDENYERSLLDLLVKAKEAAVRKTELLTKKRDDLRQTAATLRQMKRAAMLKQQHQLQQQVPATPSHTATFKQQINN